MHICVLAGADIKEMKDRQFIENYSEDFLGHWTQITKIRKPIIAAVNGFAVRLCPPFLHSFLRTARGMERVMYACW